MTRGREKQPWTSKPVSPRRAAHANWQARNRHSSKPKAAAARRLSHAQEGIAMAEATEGAVSAGGPVNASTVGEEV